MLSVLATVFSEPRRHLEFSVDKDLEEPAVTMVLKATLGDSKEDTVLLALEESRRGIAPLLPVIIAWGAIFVVFAVGKVTFL